MRQTFDYQVKNPESFSIKPTAKFVWLSLKKEIDWFIVFFVALAWGRGKEVSG